MKSLLFPPMRINHKPWVQKRKKKELKLIIFILKNKDPCSSYSFKENQYKRSSNYTIQSTDIAISDNFLSEGWYRFESYGAGNDIVTLAPSIYQCGTIYPMWMNGMY